jgi:hypothetical protein
MKINIDGFIYHKAAEEFSDCCDRYAISPENNKFSIADGVSKSFFPDIWAALLVNTFVNTGEQINFNESEILFKIQKEWLEKVKAIVDKPEQKYFVRNRFNQRHPAAATFVGLSFCKEENGNYKWESYALGDSFLFYVPDNAVNIEDDFDKKVIFLSSKKSLEFDNFPDFFDSRNENHKGKIQRKEGTLQAGIFYLMTDALAEWFIKEKENARQEIDGWKNQEDFETRIEELRKTSLNNDDSAILVIRVENDNQKKLSYTSTSISSIDELILREKNKEEQPQNLPPKVNENHLHDNEIVKNENIDSELKLEIEESLKGKEGFFQKAIKTLTGKF